MRELIYIVVESFYKRVLSDILISYHFEKFRDPEVLAHHLDRLTVFWEMQLTGEITKPLEGPGFRLLFTHLELGLKKGELGRWIVLFHKTLDELVIEFEKQAPEEETNEIRLMVELWKQKIDFFKVRFESHPMMFAKNA